MNWPFSPGELYNRRADIHGVYGGQQQSGIVTPARHLALFVFTGRGDQNGYPDRWLPDGTLRYSGEGQVGDMRMAGGNRALRDHAVDGREVLLFEKLGSGRPVRFIGQYATSSWCYETHPGRDGVLRKAIIFNLVPLEALRVAEDRAATNREHVPVSLTELRGRALVAAKPAVTGETQSRTIYERSADVRDYVLARANGRCEACAAQAPFMTKAGRPYLEPHHTRRVSDGGPDHPSFVAAVCPNCHRRAHYGADAQTFNAALSEQIERLEASIWV